MAARLSIWIDSTISAGVYLKVPAAPNFPHSRKNFSPWPLKKNPDERQSSASRHPGMLLAGVQ
jgi:hypothetical protein